MTEPKSRRTSRIQVASCLQPGDVSAGLVFRVKGAKTQVLAKVDVTEEVDHVGGPLHHQKVPAALAGTELGSFSLNKA